MRYSLWGERRRSPLFTYYVLCVSLLLLAACSPQATPFPVDLATTATDESTSDNPEPIRYALAANTAGFVSGMAQVQAAVQITQLTDAINANDLGLRYDMMVVFGTWDGATLTDQPLRVSLIVNPATAPLDNPGLLRTLRGAVRPQVIAAQLNITGIEAQPIEDLSIATLRTEMANSGYPDGFSIRIGHTHAPGIAELQQQLATVAISSETTLMQENQIVTAIQNQEINAVLVTWTMPTIRDQWVDQFGAENIIDLYAIPISYRALPELNILFTSDGWPIATR